MARTTDPEKKSADELTAARKKAAAKLRGRLGIAPGRSLVDELIAERREEFLAEEREFGMRPDDDD
jgi:hypothetical protein